MSLRTALIVLTVVSVTADTMILPFYPQFFAQAFDVHSQAHVGYYLAACCISVMLAFPVWAKIARRVHELPLWVITQTLAGLLGIACYFSQSLWQFWLLSQLMLCLKASYLMIYPYVLRLEERDKHLGMVGLFAVLMQLGGILGAVVGGALLEHYSARSLYLWMAASDGLQVLVCGYLMWRLRQGWQAPQSEQSTPTRGWTPHVIRLGLLAMVFYCAAFFIRPFFTPYWQSLNPDSALAAVSISGWLFSLPGWVALLGLWVNQKRPGSDDHAQVLLLAMLYGCVGLWLQASADSALLTIGRIIYAWALFQITVRLELWLFAHSEPQFYGQDFSKLHLMQNVGVILASMTVGHWVSAWGYASTFVVASVGLLLCALCLLWWRQSDSRNAQPSHS
ncbi:MFS transporter [Bacterioplanes sanyensis]|uniref:MFS transporter n=1 Tax=Bacterioplanes sanyensis TaxID=1249553 RepID=A0A222FEM8_9GAMM|nr:MFS transporter [Bacterioplanes sanyensis]ASP37547.1 MFS transporter [Bacterioplanes sanyensis]